LAITASAETFGGFEPAQNYPVGDGPHEVVVADFNNDGTLDLATDNANSDDISILLGNGDGTFGAAMMHTVGNTPLTIEAADVNSDGTMDLTVANGNDPSISVLFGNGDGTFTTHQTFFLGPDIEPFGGVIIAHTMGDFDNDGDSDVAVMTLTATLAIILPNDGAGNFGPYKIVYEPGGPGFPGDLEAGDFDGDGSLDLIEVQGNSLARVLINSGDTVPWTAMDFAITGHDIMTPSADLDGDGTLDMATNTTVNPGGYISVAMGNGDGSFGPVTTYDSERPSGITASDLNGDGIVDLTVTNYNPYNTVSIMLGNGDGTFAGPLLFATGGNPEGPVAVDLDGDSWPDLVTANRNGDSVSVLINRTGSVGDLNCDGDVNTLDIEAFILAMIDPAAYELTYPDCDRMRADINGDSVVNTLDIEFFVNLLLGP
jgi:hypothetical protein